MQQAIAAFQKRLRKQGISLALIFNSNNTDPNLFFFTDIELEKGFLLVPKKGNPILLVSKMEYARAKRYVKTCRVMQIEKPVLGQIARIAGTKKFIGINKDKVSLNEYRSLRKYLKRKFIDLSPMLAEQRSIKAPSQISRIKKACRIADEAWHDLLRDFSRFKTEQEARLFLMQSIRKRGAGLAFPPIVASGKNSGLVHYMGEDVRIGKGFCFVDFGATYKGYRSDMTRTVYKGKPKKEELYLYHRLLEAQEYGISLLKPKARAADIDKAVRSRLSELSERFTHNLGHGVGVEIHELPNMGPGSKDVLSEGMVLTIEPGIYFPGRLGMRVEDTVLVTRAGCRRLTRSKKTLAMI